MYTKRILAISICLQVLSGAGAISTRNKRQADLTPGNWPSCDQGATVPPTRVDTTERVQQLKSLLGDESIGAYLVPNEDAHQSEYASAYDKRRDFISGFDGSAGYAVITTTKQALWTDGRYFLEAEDTLDCNWILMRQGEPGVPTMTEWLISEQVASLGANAFLTGNSKWKAYNDTLSAASSGMVDIPSELIDRLWNSANGRPLQPDTPINALPIQFAGVAWETKVSDMRTAMSDQGVQMLVVTGLDETAWLFNLRASDISYNPFFISYAIIETNDVTLYLLNHTHKLTAQPTDDATTVTLAAHLNTGTNGTCTSQTPTCVNVKLYDPLAVFNDVKDKANVVERVWLSYSCNQAIYSAVPQGKIYQANTPIATTKTNKNVVEVQGMRNSHIRDAVALILFLTKLERQVKAGTRWTELSASNDLATYRYAQEYNRGLSFNTISGSGSNGAIIHYSVSNLTDKPITTTEMYLLDSGGQYLDGTTDVTRTFHFGTPTSYQKECYTRVLMGHINLFLAKWPKGLLGREIDAFARGPLWDVGLVYRHGTGHGIGMYLSVHEGPGRISLSHSLTISDNPLDEHQFFSDEPGYYEDGQFGIRLENIVMVKNATTTYQFPGTQFLTFEHMTLVPYAPNLIDYNLLSDKQIDYLNNYNKLVRERVGPHLTGEASDWMNSKTEPFISSKTSGGCPTALIDFHVALPIFLYTLLML